MREVSATIFKAKCLALLDEVARTHDTLVVTKRGRPVARVVPLDETATASPLEHSVTLVAEDDAAYFSTGEEWDAAPAEPA